MALKVKDTAAPRELIPARTYLALINGIYDLGTQHSEKYGSDHKIQMTFELHTRKGPARDSKGNVLVASKEFALKFSKIPNRTPAALRVAVEAIEGREYSEAEAKAGCDLESLLGRACQVAITHTTRDGTTYDGISGILTFDPDDDAPEPMTDHLYYELDVNRPLPQEIPAWIAKKIQKSDEWTRKHGAPQGQATGNPVAGASAVGGPPDEGNWPFEDADGKPRF